jgi:cytochrome c biogenesis protein CcdA
MNPELLASSVLSGFFAAFSPCNIAVYPVILNIVAAGREGRRSAAVAFTAGLALTFTVFYVAVGFILKLAGEAGSDVIGSLYGVFYAAAGLLTLLFALQSLGLMAIPIPSFAPKIGHRGGVFGAVLTGAVFATCMSSCNLGFLVTGILPVLLSKPTVLDGVLYMSAFSVSMSLPILALGILSGYALESPLKRYARKVEVVSAVFLLAASAYFLYMSAAVTAII